MHPLDDKKPTKGILTIEYAHECVQCESSCKKKYVILSINPITKNKKTIYPKKEDVAQVLVEALAAHIAATTDSIEEALVVSAHAGAALAEEIVEIQDKKMDKAEVSGVNIH